MPPKTSSKKKSDKLDVSKIRTLEKQLFQREAEIARLSAENQQLSKEKDQRATELQIINNIGQTLTEGLDLDSTLERVCKRLHQTLGIDDFGITVFDTQTGLAISHYIIRGGKRVAAQDFSLDKYRFGMRLALKRGSKPWVVNTNAEKYWNKIGSVTNGDEAPKSFAMLPMLAGRELVGSITFVDFEKENAFPDLPLDMLETIASNMGTAIQNVQLFDETQRLLKETEQRATELQIINNIGQTLTDGLDLNNTLERVGERLQISLKLDTIGIVVFDPKSEFGISHYLYVRGKRVDTEHFSVEKFKAGIRLSMRGGGRSWVVNTNAEKIWSKYGAYGDETVKSFVLLPLLAGKEVIGGITLADYEKENAFIDISINLIETIASNMGTAIQNVRFFDETQRLLKVTEQRATELQIINNIGQTLTEGLDLNNTLERVGERLREALDVKSLGIVAFDPQKGLAISNYFYHYGGQFTPQRFSMSNYKLSMRLASRVKNKPLVVNTNAERYWSKFLAVILPEWTEIPKAFVVVPLLAGGELVGSITIGDYENENAFVNLPLNLLETIASNMGTAIQNVRLFDETQRLLKETDQRATELQIINNIGQMLTEGLDLQSTLEHVGERLREVLKIDSLGIIANDTQTGLPIAHSIYLKGKRIIPDQFSLGKNLFSMHFAARVGGKPLVVNSNVEKNWRRFIADVPEYAEIPKSFVIVPLLAGKELVGSITIADYEDENAFHDLPLNLLETIASNMGTAIQNTRLFDETQRLLKETEQRATELQIINNIGTILTEGGDLNTMTQHVGERIQEALQVSNLVVSLLDKKTGLVLAPYMVRNGKQVAITEENVDLNRYKLAVRASARAGGASWVVNTNAEKSWRKFWINPVDNEVPKSFVSMPFLAGKEVIGGITIADYENENAFSDLSVNLLETIASNMGTAVQNVRLFEETQRLLKETEQRATELQIINNIGQTLTEDLDLNSTLERVGDRLGEALKFENFGIVAFDAQAEIALASYLVRKGKRVDPERFLLDKYRLAMRLASRREGKPWVVNTNAEKYWIKFGTVLDDEIAKSFVMFPLLAGRDLVGSITIADYERENAFVDFPISLIETIASNIGTVIQNVRLFDETQRLLKETEQRATELQIINNIGQTLNEGGDLESMIQRVGGRIQEALNINNVAISIFDKENERVIAPYMVRNGKQIKLAQEHYDIKRYKMMIRAWARAGGGSSFWVVNKDIDKFWRRGWLGSIADDVPKSLAALPLLAGGEIIGGISLADYEKEKAFSDLSVNLLETIASNMGTAVQNVRLFEETKRLFSEAEEARASAEQANKAKSTFLANMSHELRTPLNAIMGFTQIVKGKAEGALPEKQIGNLDKVLTSSQHLLGLINTVLDIAKIEAGRMDVIPGKFSLGSFADQCTALATPLLKPKVTLEKQVDETIGFVFSDQDKIKQIILNLLSNAAKFTHEGKIILKVEKLAGEMISISVKDSGIGISEEAVGRVFEEFQQADVSTTRQYGGTGLGLTISRNLARLLGGDLTAASVLGEGSTFTLTFPMHYEKDPASSAAIMDPVHSAEAAPTTTHTQTEETSKVESRKTILVVEDTELNINFITQLLEDDYNLLFAKNGAQGVTLAELEKPDLILMDISLPVMDGYEAARRIRVNMADTPIIGLSAYAMVGDAEKAKEAGCNDYVTKPVDGFLLKQKIKEYVR